MPRTGLLLIALVVSIGCRAPGFDPLGLSGPSRVPPPPTGTVGNNDGGYYESAPRPNLGQGAANWPASNFVPTSQFAVNSDASVDSSNGTVPKIATTTGTGSRPTLQPSDKLDWIDPIEGSQSGMPRLLPPPGQTQPLASTQPRIRGFQNVRDRRDLNIPWQLADLRRNDTARTSGVRPASANSNWQPRYDDVRR